MIHNSRRRASSLRSSANRRRLGLQQLEDRSLLAVVESWVNDNWVEQANTSGGTVGVVEPGDTVQNTGPGDTGTVNGKIFGTDAFATIQNGVDNTTTGGIVNVLAGSYSELVSVPRTMDLRGAQFGVDARTGRSSPTGEAVVQGAVSGSFRTTAFSIAADNVVLDGFTVENTTHVNQFGAAIWINAGSEGTAVRNNIVQNNLVGLFLANNNGANPAEINHNLFRNNTQPGASSGHSIYADQFTAGGALTGAIIDSNAFTNTALTVNTWAMGMSNTAATAFSQITFSNNEVTNHGRGLYLYNTDNSSITFNTITGASNYAVGLFDGNDNITIENNRLHNSNRGVWLGADFGNANTGVTIRHNAIFSNTAANIQLDAGSYAGTLDASANHWGTANPAVVQASIINASAAAVDFTPILPNNESVPNQALVGFSPDFSLVVVHTLGGQAGAVGRIQEGVNEASVGGVVSVLAGTYEELTTVNKTVELRGAQFGVDARTGRASPVGETIVRGALSSGLRTTSFIVAADNVVIDGFQIQDTTYANQFGAAIWIQGTSEGTSIRNNIVQDNLVGLFLANNNGANPAEVNHNIFRNNTQAGPAGGHSIYADQFTAGGPVLGAVIDSNLFTNTALTVNSWAMGMSNTDPVAFSGIAFSHNEITNHGRGVYLYNTDNSSIAFNTITGVTNYAIGLFGGDDNIAIDNNRLQNGNRGVWLTGDFGSANSGVTIHHNALLNSTTANIQLDAGSYVGTLDASANYWASVDPFAVQTTIVNSSAAAVDFTPLLANNESVANQALLGFTPDFSALTVHTLDGQAGATGRIQEGIDEASSGAVATILEGAYTGNVSATAKAVTLLLGVGTTTAIVSSTGSFTLNADDTLRFELNGVTPGTQHDQLVVVGPTTLGNATAAIDRNFIVPIGQKLTLIDGLPPMTGQFADLPNNAVSVIDGQPFVVRYADTDGGDFTIQPSEAPPVVIVDGKLLVSGTDNKDLIQVYQTGSGATAKIYVKINGKVHGPFTGVQCVIVYGKAGNDKIEALSSLKLPVEFHGDADNDTLLGSKQGDLLDGGAGNDTIKGNNGNDRLYGGDGLDKINGGNGCDVLVGGANGDTMFGDAGNDILIGGTGWDHLKGGSGDDIIIAATTIYDDGATNAASDAALQAISAEWCKTTAYDVRIAKIMSGTLALGAKLTVACEGGTVNPSDESRDFLRGEAGRDWFFGVTGSPDFDDLDGDRVAKGSKIERKDGLPDCYLPPA